MLRFKDILDSSFIKEVNLIGGFSKLDNKIFRVELINIKSEVYLEENTFALIIVDRPLKSFELREHIRRFNRDENISALGFYMDKNKNMILEEVRSLENLNKPIVLIPKKYSVESIKDNVEETRFFKYIYKNIEIKENDKISRNSILDTGILRLVENLSETFGKEVHVIDKIKERTYTSKGKVSKTTEFDYREILNPSYEHDKLQIYNRINIVKHTSYEGIYSGKSWIVLPVIYESITMFYIVIWLRSIKEEFDVNDYKYLYTAYMYLFLKYGEIYLEDRFKRQKEEELLARILYEENLDRGSIYCGLKETLNYVKRSFLAVSIVDRFKDNNFYNDNYYIMKETIDIIDSVLGKENLLTGIISGDSFVIIYNFEVGEISKREFTSKLEEIVFKMTKARDQYDFKLGVGNPTDDIGKIRQSYEESLEAINLSDYILGDRLINYYEDLGVFSFIKLDEIKEFISNQKKGKLRALFEEESLELLETLDVFINFDCNYKLAAEKLFIHSNTLRYRISKIENLLDLDLNNNDDRFNIGFLLKFKKLIYDVANR